MAAIIGVSDTYVNFGSIEAFHTATAVTRDDKLWTVRVLDTKPRVLPTFLRGIRHAVDNFTQLKQALTAHFEGRNTL